MANLVVCSDGTWNTPEDTDGGLPAPTNVVKLYNALATKDAQGVEQRRYYHTGVGTEGGPVDRLLGGGVGAGLDGNIKSAYKWLAVNYRPGDQIFMFGFSRGAYTVRSAAGMISHCGLLDLSKEENHDAVWSAVDKMFDRYRKEGKVKAPAGLGFHHAKPDGAGAGRTPIYFIGVWDTVGALGVPDDLALLNLIDDPAKHGFHDTELSAIVEHARHAVAMDEMRESFAPTLWTKVANRDVRQLWFPGVHSDVGGGYLETGLADGALKWMMDEAAACGLAFRPGAMGQVVPEPLDVRHDSLTGVFKALKTRPRSVPAIKTAKAGRDVHKSVVDRFKNPPLYEAAYWPTTVLAKGKSTTLDIFAREHWNATGIYLEAGKTYDFAATGQWLDSTIKSPPGGTHDDRFQIGEIAHVASSILGAAETLFKGASGNKQADFWLTRREEKMPWFSLVGVVANGSGTDKKGTAIPHQSFLIGEHCSLDVETGGYLYCFANDTWQTYANNKGSVSLTVTRKS